MGVYLEEGLVEAVEGGGVVELSHGWSSGRRDGAEHVTKVQLW